MLRGQEGTKVMITDQVGSEVKGLDVSCDDAFHHFA